MSPGVLAAAGIFTTTHIAVTAAICGLFALVGAALLLGRKPAELLESVLVGLLTTAAVFLWRKSANMPQLNDDGLNGFSANDWLAPVLTFVVIGVYGNLRLPPTGRAFGKARAVATIVALVVNVVTI